MSCRLLVTTIVQSSVGAGVSIAVNELEFASEQDRKAAWAGMLDSNNPFNNNRLVNSKKVQRIIEAID